ncbi:MAG: hypothetical protein HOK21_16025 [Rhodospirillaceae bacterium]|jgi:hypothetical protein|nr:hypothetical protein [Rhodospirillaceae bacterium]MBT4045050.1 hypothetical protein [Rhodospirillaceae bacterium]MBT5083358.1 hypothetical protein [Rhodospirillaceae bacterium]MBT5525593.1 hypothetical protein [Rhodospirillaceae bacterium]MBT5880556.1 hypothetical protein [Rhodospirillaceae bacterium]
MTKMMMKVVLATAATVLLAANAYAGPVTLSATQMDAVAAGGAPSPTGFVCPVISTDAVLNAKNGIEINGAYSILGPVVRVPVGATNDEGAGSPGGTFASPGDAGYTAIWNTAG